MTAQEVTAQVLVGAGGLLMAIAALGMIRLPDVYSRINAVAKAATLGVIFLLVGVLLWKPSPAVLLTVCVAILVQLLTAPISGYAAGRAASRSKAPLAASTHHNELEGDDSPR